ncbi:GLABROUS1 enhancer-binding protein-like [Andrographis paniculata]|uniref:GLABROUS1 enhancer-binding protein-like n=1 Tax=Andrographis paniculata TaxID=175694 RepID=UPI0021E7CF1C|nr:GLABROUS1 enhancer-binding protein-like [Andrographis paniculata]
MPKNLEPEKSVQFDSDSGEEEEDSSSSDIGSSSDTDSLPEDAGIEKNKSSSSSLPLVVQKKPPPESAGKFSKNLLSSSDDEESETESDDPNPSAVKPLASKPSGAGKNPRSKSAAPEAVAPVNSAGAKRPAEDKESAAPEARKKKKPPEAALVPVPVPAPQPQPQPQSQPQPQPDADPEVEILEKKSGEESKKLFQRLWSEDDEIFLLKGIMEYRSTVGADALSDLDNFHEYIKGDLHVKVSRVQLLAKIRRMKRKFKNNRNKEKDGKNRVFSKSHDQKAYDLSKQLWGNETGKARGRKPYSTSKDSGQSAPQRKKKASNEAEIMASGILSMDILNGGQSKSANFMTVHQEVLKDGQQLFGWDGKACGGEWRRLKIEELEVHLRKLELMVQQTKMVVDFLKSE